MSYRPVPLLSVDLDDPVAGLVSTIVAPATTAPDWSVTMPVSSELACAHAPTHAQPDSKLGRMADVL